MTGIELWNEFRKKKNIAECKYDMWAFGTEADDLSDLVAKGEKCATSSAYPLYQLEGEALPQAGDYNVILNSKEEAVCIIQITKVYVVPFSEVTAEHAYKEGEGDKSLEFWRKTHAVFFSECLQEAGVTFTENMKVVCEEFSVVYH